MAGRPDTVKEMPISAGFSWRTGLGRSGRIAGTLGFAACFTLLLLAGCQTPLVPGGAPNRAAWQTRLVQLARLDDWELEGRIGVVSRRRGGSASLTWREDGNRMSLTFSGPFGVGAVRLWGDPGQMHIRNSKGREWFTDNPQAALEQSLGWPVPLASLRYWVTGQPAPNLPYRLTVGSRGLLSQLEQEGWTVRYEAYGRSGDLLMPIRLAATRPGGSIKLIVSRWKIAATR